MKFKKGQKVIVTDKLIEYLEDEGLTLYKCCICKKISRFVHTGDFYIDDEGYVKCKDCIDTSYWHYDFELDYDDEGKKIIKAWGRIWDGDLGEYLYKDRTFTKIQSF